MSSFKSILVDDLIWRDDELFQVSGVYIGTVGHLTCVELNSINKSQAMPLVVPLSFIPEDDIYRPVDHESARTNRGGGPSIRTNAAGQPVFERNRK